MTVEEFFGISPNLSSVATAMVVIVQIGFVSLVFSFGAPYWLEGEHTGSPTRELHAGLWRTCVTYSKPADPAFESYRKCYNTESYAADDWNDHWVPGLQGLMIVALISGVFMELFTLGYVFIRQLNDSHAAVFVAMCFAFVSGALTFATIMIVGVRDVNLFKYHLSWAFAFGVVAAFFCLAASMFLVAESIHIVELINTDTKSRPRAYNPNAAHNTAQRRTRIAPSSNASVGYNNRPIPEVLLPTQPPDYYSLPY